VPSPTGRGTITPMTRTVAVVQARMTSSRLPGKVLADLQGRPMVLRQLERLSRATTLDGIWVATSNDASDDPLCEVLEGAGYPVVRGSLTDVLARFILAVDASAADHVVRITADCPLLSAAVVDRVVSEYHRSGADYLSNTMVPTYPDGLDVEVVRAEVLREVAMEATDPAEREHVTLGVYRRDDRYEIANFKGLQDLSALRWTVDTEEDLEFVRWVYGQLNDEPGFEIEDVLALLERQPGMGRTQADGRRNAALDGLDTGAMQHPT